MKRLCAAILMILVASTCIAGDDKPASGFRRAEQPGFAGRGKIDTKDKPMPTRSYVYVIVDQTGNWPISWGGCTVAKDGTGVASIAIKDSDGAKTYYGSRLVGYGSTDDYWFYQLDGVSDPSVWIGLPQEMSTNDLRNIYAARGDEPPKSTGAFEAIGLVGRGKNVVQQK